MPCGLIGNVHGNTCDLHVRSGRTCDSSPAPRLFDRRREMLGRAVVIHTYEPAPAQSNPMFFESRVYQGSSGRIYPLPFVDRVRRSGHSQVACHSYRERVSSSHDFPELGGRIHLGLDKTNGYDFFYRQNVIKPALVGLAGPWVSGGVEFNWPQHHRPATYMPGGELIEQHEDGSATVWCSDHDPMERLKAMHGVCLHPDKA